MYSSDKHDDQQITASSFLTDPDQIANIQLESNKGDAAAFDDQTAFTFSEN